MRIHRQHQLEFLGVDLDEARVGGDPQEEHDRQQHQRQRVVWGPKPVASATSASAMIEADSTVRKTAARLSASLQISDRAAIRLQCSVDRI